MEWNEYFSIFILSVIAIHAAVTLGVRLQSWWQGLNIERHPGQLARGTGKIGFSHKIAGKERSDWYAFFHCSDLTGKEPKKESQASVARDKAVPLPHNPRPSARRTENRLTLT